MQQRSTVAFLLLAPATLLFVVLTIYPLGRVLLLSLFKTEYGFEDATFVGLDNYAVLAGDSFFRIATWNTILFTITATAAEIGLGLMLALLIARNFPGRFLVIPTLIAPFVLSTMVVTAI